MFTELIQKIQNIRSQAVDQDFKQLLERLHHLLLELEEKSFSAEEKISLEKRVGSRLENIQTHQQAKESFQQLKKSLTSEYGFVSSDYYMRLGVGLGLSLGTGIGVALGPVISFPLGMIYGLILGSVLGMIVGIIIGKGLDKKMEAENRVLTNL